MSDFDATLPRTILADADTTQAACRTIVQCVGDYLKTAPIEMLRRSAMQLCNPQFGIITDESIRRNEDTRPTDMCTSLDDCALESTADLICALQKRFATYRLDDADMSSLLDDLHIWIYSIISTGMDAENLTDDDLVCTWGSMHPYEEDEDEDEEAI